MVSLNHNQVQALHTMVHGPMQRLDGRTINSLKTLGYVNKHNNVTTSGWHAINELRFIPQVKVPLKWEIETWKEQILFVCEDAADPDYDEHGNRRWTIADTLEYQFSVYEIMKFYREVQIAKTQWIAAKWDKSMDREYAWDYLESSHMWVRRLGLDAEREALNSVSNEWDLYYTGDLFYKWASDLYEKLEISKQRYDLVTSYKYSLQDNEDEHRKFWSNYQPPGKNWIYAAVSVD